MKQNVEYQIANSPKYWDCPICKEVNCTQLKEGYGLFKCDNCGYEVGEYENEEWI